MELATEIAEGPQVAIRLLKRSVYNAHELSWEQSLDEIAAKTAVTDHHPDAREGGTAFREKRSPSFNAWLSDQGSSGARFRSSWQNLLREASRLGLDRSAIEKLRENYPEHLSD